MWLKISRNQIRFLFLQFVARKNAIWKRSYKLQYLLFEIHVIWWVSNRWMDSTSLDNVWHCVKCVGIRGFSGPYFPTLSLRIQAESGKVRTRKTPNTDTFHALWQKEAILNIIFKQITITINEWKDERRDKIWRKFLFKSMKFSMAWKYSVTHNKQKTGIFFVNWKFDTYFKFFIKGKQRYENKFVFTFLTITISLQRFSYKNVSQIASKSFTKLYFFYS